jgi:hypothetical protein
MESCEAHSQKSGVKIGIREISRHGTCLLTRELFLEKTNVDGETL